MELDLFSTKALPKLKQADGFTPLENGMSYNDLVDEMSDLTLSYNQLLAHVHERENNDSSERPAFFRRLMGQFKKGQAYNKMAKEFNDVTNQFNHLMTENYTLTRELDRLRKESEEA